MEKFFVIDGKKYVRTQEFKSMANKKVFERVDIYNEYDKKISSNFYSQDQIDKMLKNASKSKK